MSYAERRFRSADGLSLYWRDYGDPMSEAVPALCLGGLTRNSKDFDRVAIRLAKTRRVICPDYRGRGRSDYDGDWNRYQIPTYLDDLRHLLAILGIGRVVAIGTSMGGILAMAMGVAMPTVLAGAVLNDVGPVVDTSGLDRIMATISVDRPQPDWRTAMEKLRKYSPPMSLKTDEDWMRFTKATFREGEDGQLHFDWDTNIVLPIKHQKAQPDLWPLFRSLAGVPTLAVRGGVSDILSRDTVLKMHAAHPNLASVEVPDVGHVPCLDEPEAEQAIDELLARIV